MVSVNEVSAVSDFLNSSKLVLQTHMKMTVNTKRLAKAMRMFNEYEGNCCNFDMSLMESMDSVMEGPTDWPTQPPVIPTIPKLPPDEIGPTKSEE